VPSCPVLQARLLVILHTSIDGMLLGFTTYFCSCSVIRQIAADTFALLSICCDDGGNLQLLTLFHFLARLHPKAQWFHKWMVHTIL